MEALFTFNSTRCAIESEKALLKAGLEVHIMAKPAALGAECGFSIRLDSGDVDSAKRILLKENLDWDNVYAMNGPDPKNPFPPMGP
jgi:hypothetical protein